jgi:pimeloyl-ACP methyl ester carboxylesterase
MLPSLDGDHFTFAFVDYRGYGKSRAIAGDYTLEEISTDANALAKNLGWESFSIVGHSMGGAAGLRTALDARAEVRSFVGITPVPASGIVFDNEWKQIFESAASNRDARDAIFNMTTGHCLSQSWVRRMSATSMEVVDPRAFKAYLASWSQCSFAEESKALDMPMLILLGSRDAGIPEDMVRATYMENHPQAKLHVVDNAGHYPMQETPVYLASQIQSFMVAANK